MLRHVAAPEENVKKNTFSVQFALRNIRPTYEGKSVRKISESPGICRIKRMAAAEPSSNPRRVICKVISRTMCWRIASILLAAIKSARESYRTELSPPR